MLLKLLKYDMKSTSRVFLPAAGVMLLCSAVLFMQALFSGKLTASDQSSVTAGASAAGIAFYVMLLASNVLVLVLPLIRFHYCVMKKGAYLMLSLPTSRSMHIISKLLCTVIWYLAAALLRGLFGLLFFSGIDAADFMLLRGSTLPAVIVSRADLLFMILTVQLWLMSAMLIGRLSVRHSRGLTSVCIGIGAVVFCCAYLLISFGVTGEVDGFNTFFPIAQLIRLIVSSTLTLIFLVADLLLITYRFDVK